MQILTEKDIKTVSESFNAVNAALNCIADNIKQSGADAMMIGDYNKVDSSKTLVMTLESFIKDASDLSMRWTKGIFSEQAFVTKATATYLDHQCIRSKKPKTKLRVYFPNFNKEIFCKTAIETFIESIKILRFDDVEKLNLRVSGYPLVSKIEFNKVPNRSDKCGEWYVTFPSTTQYKKSFLEDISKALKIPIKVDITS